MDYRITGFADEISNNLDEQIEGIKKLGMHHIEMRGVDGDNLIFHSDAKVKEIKSRLDGNGITLSALGSPLGKIDIEDPFDPHFEEFKRAVEIAHMMDAPVIRMFSFYMPEDKVSSYKDKVFEQLGSFVDYASANDVLLLHENEKGIFGAKASECKMLMDEFYGDHFKAIFDFANFVQVGQDTLEAYELLKPYIAYIHVKDALFKDGSVVPAGFGDGNVEKILRSLFEGGFNGFLSLEPHLFEFQGFAALEKGGAKTPMNADPATDIGNACTEQKDFTGFEKFKIAHDSLMNILGTLA